MKRFRWILLITPLFLQFQHSRGSFAGPSIDIPITQKMKGTDSVRTEHRIFRKQK